MSTVDTFSPSRRVLASAAPADRAVSVVAASAASSFKPPTPMRRSVAACACVHGSPLLSASTEHLKTFELLLWWQKQQDRPQDLVEQADHALFTHKAVEPCISTKHEW